MNGKGPSKVADAFTGPRPVPRFFTFMGRPQEEDFGSEGERTAAAAEVTRSVSKEFQVLGSVHDSAGVYVKVIFDPEKGGERFESLRRSLKKHRMFPKLLDSGSETVIAVFPLPRRKKSKVTVNLVMLVLTVITTVWAGAIIWMSRSNENMTGGDLISVLLSPKDMALGALTFAFPLLTILGTHELGHFFMSRRYGIDATLPYFIPVPPFISPFGTFGALISMKDPISNRKALVDIGAAGPIAGFIVAVPVTLIGLVLTGVFPAESVMVEGGTYLVINPPLLFNLLSSLVGTSGGSVLFPTALAGWIGLFVTALNLFPVGQLDGGHIARGVLGEKAKYLSFATIAVMIVLGLLTGFGTYLLFAVLILLMGGRHPPPLDDVTGLRPKHLLVAGLSVMIMALTFHPVPIQTFTHDEVRLNIGEVQMYQFVSPEHPNLIGIGIENEGKRDKGLRVEVWMNGTKATESLTQNEFGWDDRAYSPLVSLSFSSVSCEGFHLLLMGSSRPKVKGGEMSTIPLVAGCSRDVDFGSSIKVEVRITTAGEVVSSREFMLVRGGIELDLSRPVLNGTGHEVSGTLSLLEGPKTLSELRAEVADGPLNVLVLYRGPAGNGSLGSDHDDWRTFDLSNGPAVLTSINWSEVGPTHELSFSLRVEPPPQAKGIVLKVSVRMEGHPMYARTFQVG